MNIVRESLDFEEDLDPYKSLSIGSHQPQHWESGDKIQMLEDVYSFTGDGTFVKADVTKVQWQFIINNNSPAISTGETIEYVKSRGDVGFFYNIVTSTLIMIDWIDAHPGSYKRVKNT